jgi:CheY-like chemotaxis protein
MSSARGIALGAAGYLTKPIDRERLRRMIGRFRAPARPTRVLVVEDDAVQRERLRGWLEAPQWSVREAEHGREALNRIQQHKPDVILLDLMMSEDGWLCRGRSVAEGVQLAGHSGHRHHRAGSRRKTVSG